MLNNASVKTKMVVILVLISAVPLLISNGDESHGAGEGGQ